VSEAEFSFGATPPTGRLSPQDSSHLGLPIRSSHRRNSRAVTRCSRPSAAPITVSVRGATCEPSKAERVRTGRTERRELSNAATRREPYRVRRCDGSLTTLCGTTRQRELRGVRRADRCRVECQGCDPRRAERNAATRAVRSETLRPAPCGVKRCDQRRAERNAATSAVRSETLRPAPCGAWSSDQRRAECDATSAVRSETLRPAPCGVRSETLRPAPCGVRRDWSWRIAATSA
jgi:hypothetical protein